MSVENSCSKSGHLKTVSRSGLEVSHSSLVKGVGNGVSYNVTTCFLSVRTDRVHRLLEDSHLHNDPGSPLIMDLKNILIIFGLCLCFHASQGKVQFEDLFQFGVTSFDDVVDMKAERFEKLEKNVSLHRCKYACVDNTSCHGAVFSEINSDGCFPTNCTHFYSRGLHGECHLLAFKDDADVIDFAEELTGKRRNYFLNLRKY